MSGDNDNPNRAEARMKGYVGEACPECGNFTLVRKGTGLVCDTCGKWIDRPSPSTSSWLGETEEFFFLGVMKGWAGGDEGSPLPKNEGTPGMEEWRQTIYQDDIGFAGYKLIDRWGRDPDSGKPSGSVTIEHWGNLAWGMWCGGGSYKKEVLPFLREALLAGYYEKKFYGGRGPGAYRKGNLLYVNQFGGDFSRFRGKEFIQHAETGEEYGGHDYWGGSFVFLPK